jgi:UDP-glucuronate 4-epimerase
LPTTGLRFFTVYGPWGRPDMAYFSFTQKIDAGEPISVFNEGRMLRDFTYIDDIVEGIVRLIGRPPKPDPAWDRERPDPGSSYAPYKVYNIGNNKPVELMTFIRTIEEKLGKKAVIEFKPMQPGDVQATYADIDDLANDVGFRPVTTIDEGIGRFVEWYRAYYKEGAYEEGRAFVYGGRQP